MSEGSDRRFLEHTGHPSLLGLGQLAARLAWARDEITLDGRLTHRSLLFHY